MSSTKVRTVVLVYSCELLDIAPKERIGQMNNRCYVLLIKSWWILMDNSVIWEIKADECWKKADTDFNILFNRVSESS